MSKEHNYCIMRIKKLHGNGNVGGAISHHLRTRETLNADEKQISNDWFYPNGGAEELKKNINDLSYRKKQQEKAMAIYKKKLPQKVRKNAVRAIELMMTVSPEKLQDKKFNARVYLNECNRWAVNKFGKENVFFIAEHFDESTPHISILFTPMIDGKLNARELIGGANGREKLSALQDDFYDNVGKKFGLERGLRGSKAQHQTIQQYYSKMEIQEKDWNKVIEKIKYNLPEKKALQKQSDYQEQVGNIVYHELLELKPALKKAIISEQTEKRMDTLKTNFEKQVQDKTAQLLKQKVDEKTMGLKQEIDQLKQDKEKEKARLETLAKVKVPNKQGYSMRYYKDLYEEEKQEVKSYREMTPQELRQLADKKEQAQERKNNGWSR